MSPSDFSATSPGTCRKTLENYYAYFPASLPPKVELDWGLMKLISEADQAMGESFPGPVSYCRILIC